MAKPGQNSGGAAVAPSADNASGSTAATTSAAASGGAPRALSACDLIEHLRESGTGLSKIADLEAALGRPKSAVKTAADLLAAMPDLGTPAGTVAKARQFIAAKGDS